MGFLKGFFNTLADPRLFFLLAVLSLALLVWKREKIASNAFGYGLLGFLTLFFIFGAFDPNFQLIIGKPDNVPIVGLIFLLVFFVWFAMRQLAAAGAENESVAPTNRHSVIRVMATSCPAWGPRLGYFRQTTSVPASLASSAAQRADRRSTSARRCSTRAMSSMRRAASLAWLGFSLSATAACRAASAAAIVVSIVSYSRCSR